MFPRNRIGKRINSILPHAVKLHEAAEKLCDPLKFNLVLHKHLGDVFYAFACKDLFEKAHCAEIRFIVRPKHAFIAAMFGISDFAILDMDRYVLQNDQVQKALLDKEDVKAYEADNVENWFFQAVFSCVPILGRPFVCENNIHLYFDGNLTCGLSSYRLYWAYRWAANMGIDENFKFPLPRYSPGCSASMIEKVSCVCTIKRAVVFAPEAATAAELEVDFWRLLAKIVQSRGYTVIVNSDRYFIEGSVSTRQIGLNLAEVADLCLQCAYVFSLRSGLCDVIASIGKRLYVFYPSMLNREMHSLNFLFAHKDPVNEVEICDWKISELEWEGSNLTRRLQKDISRLKSAYRKTLLISRFKYKMGEVYWWRRRYYEDIGAPSLDQHLNAQKREFHSRKRSSQN